MRIKQNESSCETCFYWEDHREEAKYINALESYEEAGSWIGSDGVHYMGAKPCKKDGSLMYPLPRIGTCRKSPLLPAREPTDWCGEWAGEVFD